MLASNIELIRRYFYNIYNYIADLISYMSLLFAIKNQKDKSNERSKRNNTRNTRNERKGIEMIYLNENAVKYINNMGFSDIIIDVIKFTS